MFPINSLRLILGTFTKFRKTTITFIMSVCLRVSVRLSAWNNSAPTGQIFVKIDILGCFEDRREIQV